MFRNIPPVTRSLLLLNVLIFLLQQTAGMGGRDWITEWFGLHFFLAPDFHIWQALSYMFLHGSWSHLLLNMLSLWMFGRIIESTMGRQRFLLYYLVCGLGAALCQELFQLGQYYYEGLYAYEVVHTGMGKLMPMGAYLNLWNTIGASGSVYGVLLAFGMTYPEERIMMLFPPIPMKAKYFVAAYAAIELFSAFSTNSQVAHFAHLGGMLFGWLLLRHWRQQAQQRQSRFAWQSGYAHGQRPQRSSATDSLSAVWTKLSTQLSTLLRTLGFGSSTSQHGPNAHQSQQRRYANPDHAYNAQRKAQQERIERILDKVRRSGYASLSEDEKRDLFNNSR